MILGVLGFVWMLRKCGEVRESEGKWWVLCVI
jgi:hypothetical protein